MKGFKIKIGVVGLFLTMLFSCSMEDNLDSLYNEYEDHRVFLIEAEITPLNNEIKQGDTVWLSINADHLRFKNLLTGNYIQLDTATFVTQIQLYDRIDDAVVSAQYVMEKGYWMSDQSAASQANRQGFRFDATSDYCLKIGILFNEKGKYAIAFNNYPNPYTSSGSGYKYDVSYQWNASEQSFEQQDFVDYRFLLEGGYYDAPDLNNYSYILDNCIYEESVFFVNIN